MLGFDKTVTDSNANRLTTRAYESQAFAEAPIGLEAVGRFLKFAAPFIITSLIISVSAAVLYISLAKPMYTASVRLVFDPKSIPSFDQSTRWLEPSSEMTTRIESQVELIKSGLTARKVIFDLELMDDAEFNPDGKLRRVSAAVVGADGDAESTAGSRNHTVLGDVAAMVPTFLKNVSARRVGLSSAIEIAYAAGSPEKAARIANALVDAYISISISQKNQEAQKGVVWLEERVTELRNQAFEAKRAVERFAVVGAGTRSNSVVRKAELESIAATYLKMYENFLLKSMEAQQRISYPVADSYVVSPASRTFVSKSPKRGVVLGFSIALGLAFGAGVALARISLDRVIRRHDAVEALGLGLLGALDFEDALSPRGLRRRPSGPAGPAGRLVDVFDPSVLLQARGLHASLSSLSDGRDRQIGIVGVTSGCGATSVAAKLAQVSAASGSRTLLVDANQRTPRLSRELAPDAKIGFAEFRSGAHCTDKPAAVELPQGPFLMPVGGGGAPSPVAFPGNLGLCVERDREAIESMTDGFRMCFYDLPTGDDLLGLRGIAPAMDAVVIVAEFGVTSIDDLSVLRSELYQNGVTVLGVVLNKVADSRRLV